RQSLRSSRGCLSSTLQLVELLANIGHLPAQIIEPFFELLNELLNCCLCSERRGQGQNNQQKCVLTASHDFLLSCCVKENGNYAAGGAREARGSSIVTTTVVKAATMSV